MENNGGRGLNPRAIWNSMLTPSYPRSFYNFSLSKNCKMIWVNLITYFGGASLFFVAFFHFSCFCGRNLATCKFSVARHQHQHGGHSHQSLSTRAATLIIDHWPWWRPATMVAALTVYGQLLTGRVDPRLKLKPLAYSIDGWRFGCMVLGGGVQNGRRLR